MASHTQHWVIKNSEGELLKYLYSDKCVFIRPQDRAFRVYMFAKWATVEKTLAKLKEFGLEGCEAIAVANEEEHEQFNSIQRRKDDEKKQKEVEFQEALNQADELTEEYHSYCRICTRCCKQRASQVVFFGKCPQFDFRAA